MLVISCVMLKFETIYHFIFNFCFSFWNRLTQKITLNPKMTYFRQQETSLWSLLLRLDLWLFWWLWWLLEVCWDGILTNHIFNSLDFNRNYKSFKIFIFIPIPFFVILSLLCLWELFAVQMSKGQLGFSPFQQCTARK